MRSGTRNCVNIWALDIQWVEVASIRMDPDGDHEACPGTNPAQDVGRKDFEEKQLQEASRVYARQLPCSIIFDLARIRRAYMYK